ncbi:MAG: hypothetical protein DMG38_15170 [Acidobacteria bacterium]|nr:MAG: hypothetical protein DMG38_15170 [Acidobacteriota bacterium]
MISRRRNRPYGGHRITFLNSLGNGRISLEKACRSAYRVLSERRIGPPVAHTAVSLPEQKRRN